MLTKRTEPLGVIYGGAVLSDFTENIHNGDIDMFVLIPNRVKVEEGTTYISAPNDKLYIQFPDKELAWYPIDNRVFVMNDIPADSMVDKPVTYMTYNANYVIIKSTTNKVDIEPSNYIRFDTLRMVAGETHSRTPEGDEHRAYMKHFMWAYMLWSFIVKKVDRGRVMYDKIETAKTEYGSFKGGSFLLLPGIILTLTALYDRHIAAILLYSASTGKSIDLQNPPIHDIPTDKPPTVTNYSKFRRPITLTFGTQLLTKNITASTSWFIINGIINGDKSIKRATTRITATRFGEVHTKIMDSFKQTCHVLWGSKTLKYGAAPCIHKGWLHIMYLNDDDKPAVDQIVRKLNDEVLWVE